MRLGTDYVLIGPRLMYPAAFGIAWLWAQSVGALAGGAGTPQQGRVGRAARRVAGVALALAIIVMSSDVVLRLNRLQAEGAALVDDAAEVLADGAGHSGSDVFVNFPDRLWLDPAPFPVGRWGSLVAPIATDLTDLVRATRPAVRASASRSFPTLGHGVRVTAPVHVDMRGVQAEPGELGSVAEGTRVWLTDYRRPLRLRQRPLGYEGDLLKSRANAVGSHGRFPAGAVRAPATRGDHRHVALFLDRARLTGAALVATGMPDRPVRLDTAWDVVTSADQGDTVFVHVLDGRGRRVASADGDWWGGTVPLASRAPGDRFVDSRYPAAVAVTPDWGLVTDGQASVRRRLGRVISDRWPLVLDVPGTDRYPTEMSGRDAVTVARFPGLSPGRYRVGLGLYNRLSGRRVQVTGAGIPVDSDGRLVVGWVNVLEGCASGGCP
jgi:hypothetical protein